MEAPGGFSVGTFMGFNVGSLDGAEVRSDTVVAAVVCSVDIAAVVTDLYSKVWFWAIYTNSYLEEVILTLKLSLIH